MSSVFQAWHPGAVTSHPKPSAGSAWFDRGASVGNHAEDIRAAKSGISLRQREPEPTRLTQEAPTPRSQRNASMRVLLLAASLCSIAVPASAQNARPDPGPLTIARQGSFFVGGREVKSDTL